MLKNITSDSASRRIVSRTEFEHRFEIPTGDRAKVLFVDGRVADSEDQSREHLALMESLRRSDRLNLRRLFHNLAPPPLDALACTTPVFGSIFNPAQ